MSALDATVFVPGSYDPCHLGHVDVIDAALALFGKVVVGVLYNREKASGLFSPDERVALLESTFANQPSVVVMKSDALAVQAAAVAGADFIVKGLRTGADFEIELQMAHTNESVSGLRTVLMPCRPEHTFISSRFIREIAAQGMSVDHLVPATVAAALSDKFGPPAS